MNEYKILDVGCGNNVRGDVGVERYTRPEERKKLQLGEMQIFLKPHSPIVRSNAEVLPFRNRMFEKVIFWGTLEHFLNPYLALQEAFRVLKENGIIVLLIPNAKRIESYQRNPDHIYCWSEEEMENLLLRAGFKMEKVTPSETINLIIEGRKK